MATEEELKERYSKMAIEDLLEITKDKTCFTELANNVALNELKRRNVTSELISGYQSVFHKVDRTTKENCLFDLEFSKKLLYFYIMWLPPIRRWYSNMYFIQNGYILKNNQSNYYSVVGFASFVITIVIICNLSSSIFTFIVLWTAFFSISYMFDIFYNLQRQRRNIQKKVLQNELPWGF